MDYRFSVKALPQSDDPAAPYQDQGQGAGQPPELQPPHQDDARPWAGDAYDEGDETDPAQAFASFAGDAGQEAWLDKAVDGTLTGWVRDETGQVWRYADPDAWAIDVDDAGMAQTGGTGGQPGAGDPAVGDPAVGDPAAGDGGGLELDYGMADEVVPSDPAAADEFPEDEDPDAEDTDPADGTDPDEEDPDDEEEDEERPGGGKKGKPWE
ncbi:hypothetical protein [Streptomyces pseudogriseolus]|uniref:hypothetical protein n=1 Tax=Streptomyces pseudogriseolus TaxID=36817 RepID=UPI00117E0F28